MKHQSCARVTSACALLPTTEKLLLLRAAVAVGQLQASGVLGVVVFVVICVTILDHQIVLVLRVFQVNQNG